MGGSSEHVWTAVDEVERSLSEVAIDNLPLLLGKIEAIKARVFLRLASSAPADRSEPDRLLDVRETAERLRLSVDFLYRRARKLPFAVHVGRQLRFSSRGIDAFIAKRQGRGY